MLRNARQSGQALVAATFGLVALLGATGLAIDMGYLRYQKRLQQSAADSAALAGASEILFGAARVSPAAKEDASLNGFTDGVKNVTVIVHHAPTSGPNAGNNNAVEVIVSVVQPTFFMRIFGVNSTTLTARAVAMLGGNGIKNCMYALIGGTGIDNTGNVDVPNCGIMDDQNLTGGAHITAASIYVHGAGGVPPAVSGIVQAADPLSYLIAPGTGGGCLKGKVIGSTPTKGNPNPAPTQAKLLPGLYCNGISVTGKADVTLNPGTYVVTGGGGISFGGTGTVTGNAVTFYVTGGGNSVSFAAGEDVNLVAPTTGSFAGILFFQHSTDTTGATITGAAGSKFQGALYFPGATLTVNGGGTGAAYMVLVAKSLNLNTNLSFPSDYSSLPNGSPIRDAVIVE
jgi:hypothetical protein